MLRSGPGGGVWLPPPALGGPPSLVSWSAVPILQDSREHEGDLPCRHTALSSKSRTFCPWNSPGKNIGVGSLSLLQGHLPGPGNKPGSPALQADSLPSEPPREAVEHFEWI